MLTRPHLPSPRFKHVFGFQAPRSFGSASSTESDPFPDLLPWETLFEAQIWSNRLSTDQSVPSDVSRAEESIESPVESRMFDPSVILDPTSIEFGFQYSCLRGVDDKVLYSPHAAFAAVCWEGATISSQDEEHDGSALCRDPFSMLDLDEEPLTPSSGNEHHIRVPISASLLWSDDDSDSDSDECRTYHDDYTPVATIRDNATIMEAHPVSDFSPIVGPFPVSTLLVVSFHLASTVTSRWVSNSHFRQS